MGGGAAEGASEKRACDRAPGRRQLLLSHSKETRGLGTLGHVTLKKINTHEQNKGLTVRPSRINIRAEQRLLLESCPKSAI